MAASLTPAQKRVVAYIRRYQRRHGYPPSYRDIASGLDLAVSGIQSHIVRLEAKGVVRRGPAGQARTLKLL